ncbi:MAG: GntR family transcriptional regulator [Caulobacteraceae bacterium]|nr:GntR family transcriptional regulator [Caulobacteraceae bacterium]
MSKSIKAHPRLASPPASRRIHGSIAHDLGVAIVTGTYQPGEILPTEIVSSSRLKVSRSAYREAVRILTAKGLVSSRPKAGTRINPKAGWNVLDPEVLGWMFETEPSKDFVRDLFELRLIIEPAAAGYAAQRRTSRELARMGHALQEMERHGLATPEGQDADQTFHHLILESARNAPLMALAGTISAAVSWTTLFKARRGALPPDPMPQHHAIFDAIADGSPEKATARMSELIHSAFRETELSLQTTPKDGAD